MGSNQSPTGRGALVTELEEQEDMPNPSPGGSPPNPTTLEFSPTDSFSPTEVSEVANAAAAAIDDPAARANRRLAQAGEGRNKRKPSPPGSTTARNTKKSKSAQQQGLIKIGRRICVTRKTMQRALDLMMFKETLSRNLPTISSFLELS